MGNKSITAVLGTCSWETYYEGGTKTRHESGSVPPPELAKYQKESLTVEPRSSIVLDFKYKPDDYIVSIWQGDNPSIQQVKDGKIIAPQQKGLVVYEIHAIWKEGDAVYAFSANVE